MKKFIAVAGNIGVGKSTLVERLCHRLGWEPFYEPVTENPYLPDFYRDMCAWGFHSQVFFLTHRLRIHQALNRVPGSVIQDRSIYEDAEVFARNLHLQGALDARDWETYAALYQSLADTLPPPDLVIYLRASVQTLQSRIAQRARSYERAIADDYLARLNRLYDEWIGGFTLCPVLTVPADDLDFVAHPLHLDLILRKVQEKLTGQEVVVFGADEITALQ
ncbi:MAG TPA: deoxynucleoside kinase [Anaerolineaceae bacterium]|jgi:deoxyadenosine/deoxycytidine kinase|nr:deoxynucleoside kinase [Anaerolineaceae bacterium]